MMKTGFFKRSVCVLLALVMLISMLPLNALATEEASETLVTEDTEFTGVTDTAEATEEPEATETTEPTEATVTTESTEATEPTESTEAAEAVEEVVVSDTEEEHTHEYTFEVTDPTCTGQGYTTYTCTLCGDSYVDDYVDVLAHCFESGSCVSCGEAAPSLAGKTLSILGASISTYAGTSNGSAADSTNATIRNNVKYYPNTTIPEVTLNDTWWMQVTKDLGLRLLVNNAWSGSAILLERSGTVGAYVDRCVQLHDNTGDNAGEEPDIICIQMGFNDFSYGKDTLGTSDIDYDTLITDEGYGTPATTMEATAIMLDKMVKRYPNAEIYMFNHFRRIGQTASETTLMENLNASIADVCDRFDVTVVDLYSVLTKPEHIGDGRLHPNRLGMDTISEAVKKAIAEHTSYAVDVHTVSMNLNGVTANYVDNKIVVAGDAFSVALNAADDLKVTVTMGGKDITDSAYADGTVTIDEVTADVTITAESVHNPKDYRWEFYDTDLVCVSGDNTLTKNAGTSTNGVFNKTRYALENAVVLQHDLPWSVEWKSEGTFKNTNGSSGARIFTSTDVNAEYNARYIFKSATNWLIAMGEKDTKGSHNYGIALGDYGIDGSAPHTYRLENRISASSNMIYLFVDGEEIGPMNHYYVGTADQNTTSDWLSGKDFVFPYMGTDTHGFTNASIEYIQVFESHMHSHTSKVTAPTCSEQGYTTYTCACGDSYVDDYVDTTGVHSYENGICTVCSAEHPNLENYKDKVISILGDSISTFAGYIPVADGFNLEHYARYPQDNLLTDVNETWWMQLLTQLGAKLGVNDSWRSTEVYNYIDDEVNSTYDGTKACMASTIRIQNLGSNGTPDVILFYGGTNDITQRRTVGSFDPTNAPTEVDLTSVKWNTVADAYVDAIMRMQYYYPDTEIIAMLPTFTSKNTDAVIEQYNSVFAAICEHYGVEYVDLRDCGITAAYLPDGTHPNAEGMDFITDAVMDVLLNECVAEAGKNIVYSITHNLTDAESSLSYYKGVSHGKPFATEIIGENLVITVTMNSVDITEAVLKNGVVSIPEVTGDVLITAVGREKNIYEDYLQELPNKLCCGVNLWNSLAHQNTYYKGSSWGNNSGNAVYSVTIPITTGDQIWATSFQAVPANGNTSSSSNGIRVTWFDEDGVLKSLGTGETYSEFKTNGYLTAPDGAVAVNVPMWNNSDGNELYIVNRDHSYENGICSLCGAENPNLENYKGKVISILGDSISTYTNISNNTHYNSTIGSNKVYYSAGTHGIYQEDTWWQQTLDVLDMELCVNNSWSGSAIFGTRAGTAGAYLDRCVQLHDDQTGEEPDVIFVFLGTNDFSYTYEGGELGNYDLGLDNEIDFSTLIQENEDGTFTYEDPATSLEAYAIMLHKMQQRYPDAKICCMSLMTRRYPVYSKADVGQPTEFNAKLKAVADKLGVSYIELEGLFSSDPDEFDLYMGDKRVHPNTAGMDLMTEAVVSALLGEQVEISTVSYSLNGVESSNSAGAALTGGGYTAVLSAADTHSSISVTVTMDGEDVTASCYKNGIISISNVTGDIVITASVVKAPANYRWELDGNAFVSKGDDENTLTQLAGSVSDGVQNGTRYALSENVLLKHDHPWAVEWKAGGDWSGMLLTSTTQSATTGMEFIFRTYNTTGLLALGYYTGSQYNNYGIPLADLKLDMEQSHTYRMENRISEDGSNMVYLLIDGVETCALNHYYIGGTQNQNTTVDWVNGRDFSFGYIGSTSHPLKDLKLEYLAVTECIHSYENGICTVCSAEHPNLENYKDKVISILGDSISTFAGYIPVADGFNLEHLARYPQDDLLTDVNETWWMQVIAELDAKLGINDSWRGATASGAKPVTTGTTGENACMANLTRIQNLGSNGTPDVILFYGGTNDLAHVSKVGSFDPDTAPVSADLTTKKWDNLADGYMNTILRLQHYYPDAQIVCLLPTYTTSYYSNEKLAQGNEVLAAICEHYGVAYTDLRECGITTGDLPDGIHPDAAGMDCITGAAMHALLNAGKMEAGENMVHSVTHKLTGAESSLGYYKGVTHGRPFVTTIAGEDVTVSVTMGGADITDAVYTNGIVSIAEVTGDIVITAEGRVKTIYEDHLQQLPMPVCSGTNLWTILEHDAQYYTVNGWGIHSSKAVYSVTFPVCEDDRIYATSFGAAGKNGGSINGIRVTWFDETGVLESVSADKIYAEFAENGYLAVPEGAVAVSIPMWKVSESNELYLLNREHGFENWKLEQAQPGEKSRKCRICGYVETCALDSVENRLYLETAALNGMTTVWVDGAEFALKTDGDLSYVDLPDGNAKTMTVYTYGTNDGKEYPIGMKVWTLENVDGYYTATRQTAFDDILQYAGSSIRVTGKKGIRMITAIDQADKTALTGDGLAGYTLKEYGTVIAWASQINEDKPLVLGNAWVKSNYAYKQGVADPVFAYKDGKMQYTNVLVNFSDEQCKKDIAMRPYMILTDGETDITLYGGIVERSIGYIALQNKDTFTTGTEEYNYIWNIIHTVYGDAYDE